jgi:hypothetical protein
VTLTLGPEEQVNTVRRIFREFIEEGRTTEQIAQALNRDGIRSARGGAWNAGKVRRILTNPMYAGTLVYNKTTQKLMTPTRRNPQKDWIKTPGAFSPLVEQFVFGHAQQILAQMAQRYTPEIMLEELARILKEHQLVRPALLRADASAPSASSYAKHFTSLDAAYQQVFREALGGVRAQVESLLRDQVAQVESYEDFLIVDRRFTLLIQPSVPVPHGYSQYWYFRPDMRGMVDITLGVPVSGTHGPRILGYLVLPRLLVPDQGIRLFATSETRLDMYGHASLDALFQLARP